MIAFGRISRRALCAPVALTMVGVPAAHAMAPVVQLYHLPAQSLGEALVAVAKLSGRQIMFGADMVAGKRASALNGRYTIEQALDHLLSGSGLAAIYDGDAVVIRAKDSTGAGRVAANDEAAIVVTGSRIRGAVVASPVIVRTGRSIADAGQTSLGDALRSLPQNFAGGQNPGVTVGTGGSPDNLNVGSGSTINLRGIGQAATLTLLNGHRLAYDINSQGIDVSTIPLAALDRVEIVADGASALYGSDAVAGVANIILRPDYDGVTTSARLGGATEGGDFQQQYDLVAGRRWSSGGVIVTYDFEHDTAIEAGQRSYTDALNPHNTLLPFQRHHSAIMSAHQDIGSNVTVSLDGFYSNRHSTVSFAADPTGTYRDFGILEGMRSTAFSAAPSVKWRMGGDWTLSATSVYAQDHAHYTADFYLGGAIASPNHGCYCNSFKSVEAGLEGPIVHLPAGDARIAVGGGYRTNRLRAFRTSGTPQDIDASQGVAFAYGELALPIVAPAQRLPLVHRLAVNAALRYERYPGVANVATPKLGLVYAPASWVDVKGSWGRSFKAPTLYQQYSTQGSTLSLASALGGQTFASDATAIELTGANPDLKPERATTWTTSFALRPVRNLAIEASYFHIRYRDRVAAPIATSSGALSNPAYQSLVTLDPSDAERAAAVDADTYIFYNDVPGPIDLSKIVTIVDDRYRNISQQTIDGIDVQARYTLDRDGIGRVLFEADGSYLRSRQTLAPGIAPFALAGTIFNPPHLRGRAGVSWTHDDLTFTSYANYIGHVRDNRTASTVRVGSMTTLDLTVRYHAPQRTGPLYGIDILASVQNALDAKPSIIATDASYFPPYDSTNYSAIGRFVSLTISKAW
jgi:outer membrane receptor protein involved in Fe transport